MAETAGQSAGFQQSEVPEAHLDIALDLIASSGKDFWMQANGNSMLPLIQPGDHLHVKKLSAPPIRGEILVYRRHGGLTAHRLLALSSSKSGVTVYRLQGDDAVSPDPPISALQVIGRVAAIRRRERELRLESHAWMRAGLALAKFRSPWMDIDVKTRSGACLQRLRRWVVQRILWIVFQIHR